MSDRSPPVLSVRAWLLRHVRLGCALGCLLALADLVLVPWVGVPELGALGPLSWRLRILGAALTVAMSVALALVLGTLSVLGLRWRATRVLAISLSSSIATVFVAAHVVGLVVRIMSGSFVTLGGLEFVMGSLSHFADAAFVGYARYTYPLFIAAVGLGVSLAVYLRRPAPGVGSAFRQVLPEGVIVVSLAAAVLFAGVGDSMRGVWRTTPELALIGSLDPRWTLPKSADPKAPKLNVEPGLPQTSGRLWEQAVRRIKSDGEPRPKVLFLMLESVGIDHLGYNGYTRGTTPNLDRIAARSARFRKVWTTATHSNYAQPAALSSLFPRRGATLDMYTRIDYPRMLYHDVFYRLGYKPVTISSQDETWQGMLRFQTTDTPVDYWHAKDYTGPHVYTGSERVVPDHATAQRVGDYIREHRAENWSLYVNFQMTHFPYVLPDSAKKPYQPSDPQGTFNYLYYGEEDLERVKNRYDNALHYVDQQIGVLERALEESGQLDDTLWVITSDHGEAFYQHGGVTHGKTLYDEEARVPLLFHWPGHVKARDIDEPTSHLDILPTLLDLVNVPAHPSYQGRSMANLMQPTIDPVLSSDDTGRRGVFINIQGIRNADGLVCWPWKLVLERSSQQVMLFNLENDPGEQTNRVIQDSRIAAQLAGALETQMTAQSRYHKRASNVRKTHYQPRLLACPELPGVRRADLAQ
ncbi:MAG: sulfatase [Polyangiaceae bacterium]